MTQTNLNKPKKPETKHIKLSHRQLVITAVVTLVVLNLVLFSALYRIQTLTTQQNSIIPIGQEQAYHDISITTLNVAVETGYIMGIEPTEDEKIISVWVIITNNSDENFEFYPTAQTFIRDNQGSQYIMTPVDLKNPFVATTIKPGETKQGQLSYLVTNRAVPLYLYIESRQTGAGPFVFKLQ